MWLCFNGQVVHVCVYLLWSVCVCVCVCVCVSVCVGPCTFASTQLKEKKKQMYAAEEQRIEANPHAAGAGKQANKPAPRPTSVPAAAEAPSDDAAAAQIMSAAAQGGSLMDNHEIAALADVMRYATAAQQSACFSRLLPPQHKSSLERQLMGTACDAVSIDGGGGWVECVVRITLSLYVHVVACGRSSVPEFCSPAFCAYSLSRSHPGLYGGPREAFLSDLDVDLVWDWCWARRGRGVFPGHVGDYAQRTSGGGICKVCFAMTMKCGNEFLRATERLSL
jgi:hypothetical protein